MDLSLHLTYCKTIQAIRDARFTYEDQSISVTISAGVATAIGGEFAEDLLKRADQALYGSKHAGRDCGHFHNGASLELISSELRNSDTSNAPDAAEATDGLSAQAPQVENDLDAACNALRDRALQYSSDSESV